MTPPSGALATVYRWLDALDDVWANSVVSFDENSRASMLTRITPEAAVRSFQFLDTKRDRSNFLARLLPAAEGWRVLISSIVVVLSVFALWFALRATAIQFAAIVSKRWALRRMRKDQPAVVGVQGRFYSRILASLRKLRLDKPAGVPPLHHADSIARSDPQLAEHLRSASRLYYKLRFGRTELSDAEAKAADQHAAAVESLGRAARTRVR